MGLWSALSSRPNEGHRKRVDAPVWYSGLLLAIAAGCFLGQASDLFIGAGATVALIVVFELAFRRFARVLWTTRLRELLAARL